MQPRPRLLISLLHSLGYDQPGGRYSAVGTPAQGIEVERLLSVHQHLRVPSLLLWFFKPGVCATSCSVPAAT